ncbi:hypothetical protein [Candidatus Binatus soli]
MPIQTRTGTRRFANAKFEARGFPPEEINVARTEAEEAALRKEPGFFASL